VEKRDLRRSVRREATIIFGAGKIRCTVCNSSQGGALLAVSFTEWLPPRFVLEDSGVRRQVAVAWQGSEHIGVRYLDQPPQRPAPIFGRRKS
jgi:hypothetical protein